jgi:hypothetical protein
MASAMPLILYVASTFYVAGVLLMFGKPNDKF